MFNNLVESRKHTEDFKRKSSFFLGTIAIYTSMMLVGGVASVYAYDAHLDNQSLELVSLLSPVPIQEEKRIEKQSEPKPANNKQQTATRTQLVARIADSTKAPEKPSSEPSKVPEMPKFGNVVIGNTNCDVPVNPPGQPTGNSTGSDVGKKLEVEDTTPPPQVVKKEVVAEKKSVPNVISKGVINGQATSLPKPAYPQIAKTANVSGQVSVQVLIDESGRVISANVVSGHPLLRNAAVTAAKQAKFTPTKLSDTPVKVNGMIVYNFAL